MHLGRVDVLAGVKRRQSGAERQRSGRSRHDGGPKARRPGEEANEGLVILGARGGTRMIPNERISSRVHAAPYPSSK